MFTLPLTLSAWRKDDFNHVLKAELQQQLAQLPLQQALSHGNYVADTPVTFIINRCEENAQTILIYVDVFYQSIIAGCSCTDDPTPMSELNEYCPLLIRVDKNNAQANWEMRQE